MLLTKILILFYTVKSHSDPDLRPKKPQPTKNSDIDGRIPEDTLVGPIPRRFNWRTSEFLDLFNFHEHLH